MRGRAIFTAIIVVMIMTIWVQCSHIKSLKVDRDVYKGNTEALLGDIDRYNTENGLNVAKIGVLTLRASEYERYRSADVQIINNLKTQNRTLEMASSLQTLTIAALRTNTFDSIRIIDNYIIDTLKCFNVVQPWLEISGCIDSQQKFAGQLIVRDSLLIVGTVQHKRFLGFLWRTKRIKSREVDVVSRNPHTQIGHFEYIEVKE